LSVAPLACAHPLNLVKPETLIVPSVWLNAPGDTPVPTTVPVIDPNDTACD
jgi:hypothetical protein